jgi:hypothetical protein
MSEVKLIYVNGDGDFTEVNPTVDTTTFNGLTLSSSGAGITMNGTDIDMGGGTISDLADPVADQDAATKAFVIQSLDGLDVKNSVKAGSVANISLTAGTSPDLVDGINVKFVGARILVKNQSSTSGNGIYQVSSVGGVNANTWIRSTDADTITNLNANAFTFIEESTSGQEDTGWVVTSSPATLGSDPIIWTQFSKKGTLTAAFGTEIVGTEIRLNLIGGSGGSGGLEIVSDEVGINFAVSPFNQASRPVQASDLASTSTGEGASIIGIEDVGGFFTGTDVEAALQELGSDVATLLPQAFTMTTGAPVSRGDLLYMTANNIVEKMPINALHRPIGCAVDTKGSAQLVGVIDHGLLTGVVGSAVFGTRYYWSGTAWTTTQPSASGNYVWAVGTSANATDVIVFPVFIKKNA